MAESLESSVKVVADAPSKTDLLGFASSVDALLTVICSKRTVTPFTIGIVGDWGVGKSTMMMQLADKLAQENYPTVVFNPWKYDGREEILNALVQTILLTFSEAENRKQSSDTIKELISSFSRMIASSAVSKITGGTIDLDKVIEDYSNLSTARVEFINRFESVFGQLVNEYAGNERLVIFIDDLDRCVPENAIKVLESIKLFLSVPKCVFVIGLEQDVIQEGIKHRYGDKIGFSGKDYLEKIIQLPFKVPTPSENNIISFINYMAGDQVDEDIKSIAMYGSESNPRRIKRFLNSFQILLEILEIENSNAADKPKLNNKLLALILILEIRFPEIYAYFALNLKDCSQLIELFSQGKFFEREEIERLSTTNKLYADLISQPVFQRFGKNIALVGLEKFNLGDEGLIEYFSATRATSSISTTEEVQQYYLPEFSQHGSIFQLQGRYGDLVLLDVGDKKVSIIKLIRSITGLGLKEAKDIVDVEGSVILENVTREDSTHLIAQFEEQGAKVAFK